MLIGPGVATVDFTVNKDFLISERLGKIQFRTEFFNLFNRPNFGAPGGSLAAPAQLGRIIQFGAKYVL